MLVRWHIDRIRTIQSAQVFEPRNQAAVRREWLDVMAFEGMAKVSTVKGCRRPYHALSNPFAFCISVVASSLSLGMHP